MSAAQFEERAEGIAHLLVRVYEIHEIIIAEADGSLGCCYASRSRRTYVRDV